MVHTLNLSAQEAEAGRSVSFEASFVCKVSSITARAMQRNFVLKKQKTKANKKKVI